MKQIKVQFACLLLMATCAFGKSSVGQLEDLNSFIDRFVPHYNQELFRKEYAKFLRDQQITKQKAKKSKKMNTCAQDGKIAFEANESALAKEIADAKCSDRFCRTLYIRYGAYQQFLKNHAQESRSLIGKARACAQDVKMRVTHWVQSWRKTDQV